MDQLPPEIIVTAQLDLLPLVRKLCPTCAQVFVPPGAENEPDIFRCKAASGRHCVSAINTQSCIRQDETRAAATANEPFLLGNPRGEKGAD